MSEETIELVHELYISDKSIDESTLPTEIVTDITTIDDLIDQYSQLEEDDTEKLKTIEDMSKKIKADIMSWENIKESEFKAKEEEEARKLAEAEAKAKTDEEKEAKVDTTQVKNEEKKESGYEPFFWL